MDTPQKYGRHPTQKHTYIQWNVHKKETALNTF